VIADLETAGGLVHISDAETILRGEGREVSILAAQEEMTLTHARYSGGQNVAGPHIHHRHTDAFYVVEGELTFRVGCEAETVAVRSGGLVAVPPGVAHAFANGGGQAARWLTIHANDGGFGAFMRGVRDHVEVEWDIAAVPPDGGLPASTAIVSPRVEGEPPKPGEALGSVRAALRSLRRRVAAPRTP
jgi:mannose-6-phosphate isomerase-like protein (cupin superfamily)